MGVALPAAPAAAQTIGVSMVPPIAFFEYLRNGMQDTAQGRPGLSVQFAYAENGAGEKQIAQVKGYIAAKVDALIVLPADAAATTIITRLAQEANIPLVYVNNGPREDWFAGRVALTIPNDLVAGRLQMSKVAQLLKGRGRVAILGGPPAHSASQLRTQGVKEVMSDYPGITLGAEAAADWDRVLAEKVVSRWLAAGEKLDAILANNDEMAIGAANAVEAAKPAPGRILIAGVDATPDGLKAMQQKRIVTTVLQDAQVEGQRAVENALKLIRNEPVQQYDWIDFELVTAENLSRFVP